MRVMIKVTIPVESGNDAIRSGKLAKVMQDFIDEFKPEGAYFLADGGERAALFFAEMREASQIPGIAERFFFGLNAGIEITPVMVVDDLRKGLSGVSDIINRYG